MLSRSKDDAQSNNGHSPGPIPSAIKTALESNVALQAELKRRLLRVKRAKVRNRRDAASVAASIPHCWDNDPYCSFEQSTSCGDKSKSQSLGGDADAKGLHHPKAGDEKLSKGDSREPISRIKEIKSRTESSAHGAKTFPVKWRFNPNRSGTRRFFVDPEGSTPEPWVDDIMRKFEMVKHNKGRTRARVIFDLDEAQSPVGDPKESWDGVKEKSIATSSLEKVRLRIVRTLPNADEESSTAHFSFYDSKRSKTKFTKEECLFIMSMISRLGGAHRDVDWHDIATKHFAKFKRQTPWRCFSHFRSSLENPATRCPPWSKEEDELFLKYVAAHGPQYLLQGESLVQMCKNIFPLRNSKQITLRAHSTLINPSYIHNAWNAKEKRKLAILMRVYSKEPQPINSVARMVHFPQRAPKSVTEKWIKRLDPSVSHRPFTSDEDDELYECSDQWSAVGKKFPNKPYGSLKRRWAEVADEQAVATHYESALIRKKIATQGLLSLQDFIVLPKSAVGNNQQNTK
ncbi:hypothetical protein ACHAWF_010396 [Thalassiosira exigua]